MKRIIVIKKTACAPCAVLSKLLPGLQAKYVNAEWEIIEVTDADELSEEVRGHVRTFPTTLLYNETGEFIGKQPGSLGVDQFLAKYLMPKPWY